VIALLGALQEAGATDQVTPLASRVASHTSLDYPGEVARLLGALRKRRAKRRSQG
jgi:hypothetical protein